MNKTAVLMGVIVLSFAACDTGRKVSTVRGSTPAAFPSEMADLVKADFRYSPPWWQTAICLPDDWQKTLVSKDGALLYDYPGEFSGFGTKVSVALEESGEADAIQSMDDPRLPIVNNVLKDKTGKELMRWSALAIVPGDDQNLPAHKKGAPTSAEKPPRGDLLLISKPDGNRPISLTIESKQPLDMSDLTVFRGRQRFLSMSAAWTSIMQVKNGLKIIFPARIGELAIYCASGHEAGTVSLDWAKAQPERARRYWASRDFPYDVIHVPDPALQGLLDSCIRNIYQAREIKDGLPIFQVGPTCYRGLWIVDGAFILEAMTFLGKREEARAGIRHLLTRQKPDGSFEIIASYWKENGIVLYILCRHALLTQDLAWLRQNWETVKKVVHVIKELRVRSRTDPAAPEAGLMPAGFPDGGIGGTVPEYTNVYWNLAGLKAAIEAARLIQARSFRSGKRSSRIFWRRSKPRPSATPSPPGTALSIFPSS